MLFEFKLPDIGEGLVEGEIVQWHVKEGDWVKENQPLVSILTDKAEVEIPSPKSGKVSKLFATVGKKVKVGEPLVSYELPASGGLVPGRASLNAPIETNGHAERAKVLSSPPDDRIPSPSGAMPAVRKLAADLGVELAELRGTGPNGRITEEDVRKAAGSRKESASPTFKLPSSTVLEEKVPFIGLRRRTAEKVSDSIKTIPHVTHADEADYTALMDLRKELESEAAGRGISLSYLPFILKAVCEALKEFPNLNATLDETEEVIIRKRFYNIGVATNTDQGLVVPVVKNVSEKNIWDLAIEISRLVDKARAHRIEPADMQGGTFTVTNIGPIGGVFATPIILPSEAGILGVMKIKEKPVAKEGAIVLRHMGFLCLSFDHRILDGAEAAQFLNNVIRRLENPRTLL